MRQQGHSVLTFKEQAGPKTEFTKAFNAVPLPRMRIWAYHTSETPVTTNTSQRCTIIQHIYSTSRLRTGKNAFTPSLFTCKVVPGDLQQAKRVKRTRKQKIDNTFHTVSKTSVLTDQQPVCTCLCALSEISTTAYTVKNWDFGVPQGSLLHTRLFGDS